MPQRLGFMRPILLLHHKSINRFSRLGQGCQSMELVKLPLEDQPCWTHRFHQHSHCLSRWFIVRFRWQSNLLSFLKISNQNFQDGITNLWDLNDSKHLYLLPGSGTINALAFSPNRYWLCAAFGSTIKVNKYNSSN